MSAGLDARIVVARSAFTVDVRLSVDPGKTLALMGRSGAGKSTLIEALAGILRLDDGHIEVGGTRIADRSVHLPPAARAVGLLGQEANLFPHLTAAENIAFAARAAGSSKAEARREALERLARLGLGEFAEQRPHGLSGGQRQRIALARALAAKPRLMLLDEPFASLDVEAAADMRILIREELHTHGTTAVLVSHDAVDAVSLADRLIVLDEGRIVQEGAVDAVLGAPANRFVSAVAATVPAALSRGRTPRRTSADASSAAES